MRYAINNNWKFSQDFKEEYLNNILNSKEIQIPHTVKELPFNYFNIKDYEMISTYQKILNYKVNENERIYITFDGVMVSCKVYLNGVEIGEHFGGYTEFKFDLTDHFKSEEDNLLVVIVDSHEQKDVPPFGNVVDYLCYGGIYREVYIDIKPKINIDRLMVEGNMYGQLRVRKNITNPDYNKYELTYKLIHNDEVLAEFKDDSYLIKNYKLWDLDNPNLYYLEATLTSAYGVDKQVARFGFRTVEFKKNGFYLNGNHIKLLGLNRHQSYAYVGYAMPKSMQIQDADLLKYNLGVNYVRCSHYPMSKHFLNRCDEIGLLALEEIPGWQYVSKDNQKWRSLHLQNVKDMIETLFNHPSIMIWGVRINEGPDDHELYTLANEIAKNLDPSRPTGGIRNFKNSELLEDVYTYNDFYHYGPNKGLDKPKSVCKDAPYLVTEFNGHMYPTKMYDQEDRLIEHTLRHARVLDAMYGNPRISGCSGWCMNDYNTHKDFGSGDMICYHGVCDMFRNPKYAASVYASQQDKFFTMQVLSCLIPGEKNETLQGPTYVFTNADYIEFYKNGKPINRFYPDKKQFKNLPHPPIIINDYVGRNLVENTLYDEKDALKMTDTLNHTLCNGMRSLRIKDYFRMLKIMIKYHKSVADIFRDLAPFATSWGDASTEYEIRAFKNNELVEVKKLGPSLKFKLTAQKELELHIDETYDVKEIFVKAVDQNNQVLKYCFEPLNIEVTGDIELIGPSTVNLQSGVVGVYIKSKKQGEGKVVIKSRFNDVVINVKVYEN
jgi:beta-galactosidase